MRMLALIAFVSIFPAADAGLYLLAGLKALVCLGAGLMTRAGHD